MRPGVCIDNEWREGIGAGFNVFSPIHGQVTWQGRSAEVTQVQNAVMASRAAFPKWSTRPLADRIALVKAFADRLQATRTDLARSIVEATGKPFWEALQEADLLPAKVKASLTAHQERLSDRTQAFEGYQGRVRFRPHGVVAVLGPYNLPAHLPHSHIIPALLAGNTVVFKPSEFTPGVGEWLMQSWMDSGLPPGVLNLVQGGKETGEALASQPGLDGLYFTGSYRGGVALSRLFSETPGKILALEMGGNNPLVVWDASDPDLAAALIVQSAFLTAGQRCVCARRLILPEGHMGDTVLERLLEWTRSLHYGLPEENPEPFYGTVIHAGAAKGILDAQAQWLQKGARALLISEAHSRSSCLLSPGILDVTGVQGIPDEEVFGPLLQVIRVSDFSTALQVANQTSYGLSAGLISRNPELWQEFITTIRAGVVNWNRQITGASGLLPFGGIGRSGNHRPSAAFAADYCAYPMASLESPGAALGALPPGLAIPK